MKRPILAVAALFGLAAAAHASPVVMILLDGLRPGDATGAPAQAAEPARADGPRGPAQGVIGVLPTLTYPSHTTLLTGVSPAQYGVSNNRTFDPASGA